MRLIVVLILFGFNISSEDIQCWQMYMAISVLLLFRAQSRGSDWLIMLSLSNGFKCCLLMRYLTTSI